MTYIPYLVPVSVKGIVFDDDGVWLRSNERGEWELPRGKIDPGEQPTETVVRSFWVIPMSYIIGGIIGLSVLVALIVGIVLFLRGYKCRILRNQRGGYRR